MREKTHLATWIVDLYALVGQPYYPHGERFPIEIPEYIRIRRAMIKEKEDEGSRK